MISEICILIFENTMKKHNYSAGPCILPQEVFDKSAKAILNFNDSGLSLLEISHRSNDFVAVMEEARALVLELLGLPSDSSLDGSSLGIQSLIY
jgi:phosphoserine aminotransferase